MRWDPNLSPAQIERLDLLVEECSEVIKACQKIKRFGYFSTYGGSHPPNIDELMNEIGDVEAIVAMMRTGGEINAPHISVAKANKLHRVGEFTRFQEVVLNLIKEGKSA